MDLATLVRRIKRQFGDEYDVIITDDDIYGWIYEAELDIIRNAPDSCIFTQSISNPTGGIGGDFPLPIPVVVTVQRVAWDNHAIQYKSRSELDDAGMLHTPTSGASGPSYWFVDAQNIGLSSGSDGTPGRSVFLYPGPPYSKSSAVLIQYTKVPELLTGAVDDKLTVPEVFHTDVVTFCLARAHNKNQNAQSEKMQMDLYDKSLSIRRNEANTVEQNSYKQLDPFDMDMAWDY